LEIILSIPIQLSELKAPVHSKVILEKIEVKDATGAKSDRLRVKGVFQAVGLVNENNRRYGEPIWVRNLAEDSPFKKRLASKTVLGELEHPDSGMTHLGRVSHLVEDVWLETLADGNPYDVKPGKWVLGSALIFNTPLGQILQELYTCGVIPGVSSRGRGDVETDDDGVDEVSENYECETFDFVASPSVVKAYPMPLAADGTLKTVKALSAAIKESQGLCKLTNAGTGDIISAVELGAKMGKLYERLNGVKLKTLQEQRMEAMSNLKESVAVVVTEIRKRTRNQRTLPKKSSGTRRKEKAVSKDNDALQIISELADRLVQAERANAVLRQKSASPKGSGRMLEVLQHRYDRLVRGANILLQRARQHRKEAKEAARFKEEKETVEQKYETAVRIGEKLRTKLLAIERKPSKKDDRGTRTTGRTPVERKGGKKKPRIDERRRTHTATRRRVTERTAARKVHDPAGSRRDPQVKEAAGPRSLMSLVVERTGC